MLEAICHSVKMLLKVVDTVDHGSGVGGYLKVGGIIGKARRAAAGGRKGRREGGVFGEGAASPLPTS